MSGTDELFQNVAGSLLEMLEHRAAAQKSRTPLSNLELANKIAWVFRNYWRKKEAGTLTDQERERAEKLAYFLSKYARKQSAPADRDAPRDSLS